MRGMIAPRAEEAIANAADCTATRARISAHVAEVEHRLRQQRQASSAQVPSEDQM